jgi:hypothetical protein
MNLRALLLHNLWWKLISLSLAILVWLGANLFMSRDIQPAATLLTREAVRVFDGQPVRLLASPAGLPPSRLTPAEVKVAVSSDLRTINNLGVADVIPYVDLSLLPPEGVVTGRVEVRLPPGVKLVSVVPSAVALVSDPTAPSP